MPRTMLSDKLWQKLKPILLDLKIYDKPNLRNTLEGILFRLRNGCTWRDIPEAFGCYNTIFKTIRRWAKSHKFIQLFHNMVKQPDLEWIFIDGSYIRAHQHSSGACSESSEAIAKSRGGNTSKIHLAVDAHGNPIDFIISDGATHDVSIAPALIERLELKETKYICADKGYDSEKLREQIRNAGAQANIPKKKNAKTSNKHMNWDIYKIRHLVENAFARLKHYRAIATRYDKLEQSFASTIALACAFIWLKL